MTDAQNPPAELYCVEIRTHQWEAMLHWYRTVLGLRVLVRVVEDRYALLSAGGMRLALLGHDQPGEATLRWRLVLEVPDLETAAARLTESAAISSVPRPHAEGWTEIVTQDPDGNSIRLFSWPKR